MSVICEKTFLLFESKSLWAQCCIYLIIGITSWIFLACQLISRFQVFQWELHVTHYVAMLIYSEVKMKLKNTYM